jgi:NAD dependent epimerase/dehydratase family enzyme
MQKVLITGGTGLIGSRLSVALVSKGYQVIHLSRKENLKATFPAYKWNIDNGEVDIRALEEADYIVHLAGAGVADKPWTAKRKQLIIDSRVKSGALLQQKLKEIGKRQPCR